MAARRFVHVLLAFIGLMVLAARAVETHVELEQQEAAVTAADGHGCRIPPVDAVDVNAYVGKWYQVSGDGVPVCSVVSMCGHI